MCNATIGAEKLHEHFYISNVVSRKKAKVIKRSRSLLKKVAHIMCATSGKDVKDLDSCNMASTSKLFIYKVFDNLNICRGGNDKNVFFLNCSKIYSE